MKLRLIIIFWITQCFIFSYLIWADDATPSVLEVEHKDVVQSLAELKNPFLSPPLPPKLIVVEPPHQAVKPVKTVPPPHPPSLPPRKIEPPVDPSSLGLSLQGIVWGEMQPKAIINNQTIVAGDAIGGARALTISQKGVRMIYKNVEFMLTLDKGIERISK